jgi:hypothetical protein
MMIDLEIIQIEVAGPVPALVMSKANEIKSGLSSPVNRFLSNDIWTAPNVMHI